MKRPWVAWILLSASCVFWTAAPAAAQEPAGEAAGRIVFCSNRAEAWRIWSIAADGSDLKQLTRAKPDEHDVDPVFRPDGRQILFTSTRGGTTGVWTMAADGTGLKRICDGDQAEWSPDGKSIVLRRDEKLLTRELATGRETPVSPADWAHPSGPAWSPDGKRIAFACRWEAGNGIFLTTPQGGEPTKVYDQRGACEPHWSPDGERLIYETETHVYTIGPDGTKNRPVTWFGGVQRYARFSPDGQWIVFCQGASPQGPWELYLIPARGGSPRKLTEGGSDMYPDWGDGGTEGERERGREGEMKSIERVTGCLGGDRTLRGASDARHRSVPSSSPLPLSPSPPRVLLHLAAALTLCVGGAATGDSVPPADPFVYLFDTGTAARTPLPVSAMGARSGWKKLEEDDLTHRFAGDVAMANNKLVVLLRRHGPGAEVYSWTAVGWRRRAVLMPLPMDGQRVVEWTAVTIVENQPGAAVLEVSHRTEAGGRAGVRYRLTTGRALVEVVPKAHADRLVVWTRPELLVVPEFLADDAVFGPQSLQRPRTGLPTEGLLLHMLAGGDAMLMCVWPERSRSADALMTDTAANRRLGGCEVRCEAGKAVWVALLEGRGIWHGPAMPGAGASEPQGPPWEPSFSAKWRVDLLGDGVFAESAYWDDGAAAALPDARPALVYPIDRSRTTPLSRFTPGDVVRDTLGVGPCQYVLRCEGLADPARPTPENVAAYVEQQLRKPKADRDRKEIGRRLTGAVEHVRQAEARIGEYREFAVEVEALLAGVPGGSDRSELEELQRSVARLKRITRPDSDSPESAGAAEQSRGLADAILGLADKEDPLSELEGRCAELCELGARQSRLLAGCRLTVRWLREQARAPGAGEVRARCEAVLKTKPAATTDPASVEQ